LSCGRFDLGGLGKARFGYPAPPYAPDAPVLVATCLPSAGEDVQTPFVARELVGQVAVELEDEAHEGIADAAFGKGG
jgi:hypothetical protein